MATASLGPPPSASLLLQNKPSRPKPPPVLSSLTSNFTARRLFAGERRRGWTSKPLLAFPGREQVADHSQEINGEEYWMPEDDDDSSEGKVEDYDGGRVPRKTYKKPCELYLCNLPRSFDIGEIAQLFAPFGTVTAVQVSKNPNTGQSRGAAYVTMASTDDAKKAVAQLEGTDVGGREIRVRFSTEMRHGNKVEMNQKTVSYSIYEGPYMLYVGNLPWATRPEDVWKIFSEFGMVVSVRLVHDRRTGKLRVYAFVSYNTAAEHEAALSTTRKSINGRQMVLRRFGKSDGSFYTNSSNR